jgi:hypothetical protein
MGWRRVLLCLAPLALGSAVYALMSDFTLPILKLELAWSARTAAEVTEGRVDEFRDAITADYPFIVGYTATIILACAWGWPRRIGVAGCVMAVAAALCDILENLSLQAGLARMEDVWFERAAVAAGVKFALLAVVVVLAVAGLVRIAGRPAPRT